jgi:hypothetical protein
VYNVDRSNLAPDEFGGFGSMSKFVGYMLVLIMILTIFACGETQPAVPPTPISYSDADLRNILNLIESNKMAAENQYKDTYIRLSGEIREIGENDIDLIPFGSDEFQMSGADCDLADSEKSKVLNLRKGQTITVKGKVSGISTFMIKTIDIEECLLGGGGAAPVAISTDAYVGCKGLEALIPRIKTDAGGVSGLNIVVNLGDESTCNDTIGKFNKPEMLKY